MSEQNSQERKNYLDIYSIKKGRRVLIFLADFFIILILGIFLFNLVVYPLGGLATNAKANDRAEDNYSRMRLDILYDNEILFYDTDEKYAYDSNLEYTNRQLLSYYVLGGDISNEVVFTYYHEIKGMAASDVVSFYEECETNYQFFNYEVLDSNGLPTLKDNYLEEFKPAFDDKDEMNSQGEADYDRFNRYFFLNLYGRIMTDIQTSDLSSPNGGSSYMELTRMIEDLWKKDDVLVQTCTIISYLLSVIILSFILPQCNRRGKTLGFMFMKSERVQNNTLNVCTRFERVLLGVYYTIFSMGAILFIPYPTISFAYLFGYNMNFIITLIGIVFMVISCGFLIFSKFNQTLSDLLTRTVIISSDDLEKIYKQKGYL